MSFWVTYCGNEVISIFQDGGHGRSILLPVSYLLTSLASEGQNLSTNQISSTSIVDINQFMAEIWRLLVWKNKRQTSTILKFYFRFRSRPFPRNLHFILHQRAEFRPNRNTHCGNMTSYPFLKMAAATAIYYFRFPTCWRHCLQKVKVYQQTKFRRDISIGGWDINTSVFEIQTSAILEFYFRFRSRFYLFRRNRRVMLHPAAEFCLNRNIHRWNMTSYRFSKWRLSAMLYLLWGDGGPPMRCLSWSEFRPQIATSSD